MTKEQFDLKYRGEKLAVHCDTEEKAKAFLSLADSFGIVWIFGNEIDETFWERYEEKMCYLISKDGRMKYADLDFLKSKGYSIVEFELDEPNGYAIEDTPSPMKETFNIGNVVYAKKNGVELKVTETDLYRLETKDGTAWFMKKEQLTHKKPLKKITKKELADMGYEVEE